MAEPIPPPPKITTQEIIDNPYNFLDRVLGVLQDTTEDEPMVRDVAFNIGHLNSDIGNRDKHIIFEKLKSDGYVGIKKDNEGDKYYITFKGLLLLKDKGYVEMKKKEAILENLQLLMTVVIALGSGLATLGTFGLLYFEYVKHNHHYPHGLKFWKIAVAICIPFLLVVIMLLKTKLLHKSKK